MYCGAQSLEGVTGVRDTSFNNQAAYRKHIKKYPFITLVKRFELPDVKETLDTTFRTVAGKNLMMDIFQPQSLNNEIAIIIIHGGGWRTGNKSQHHPLAQRLASMGFTCFTPEYRLSTEALFPAAILDIQSAIRWVRSHADHYHFDPEKIQIFS